ncbi:hypothetical protein [Dokdonella sp.]|uniref:hypothetical protein n=1 Tax=Dokdonella sp. TaxID=2291710 RepID=UPI002618D3C6|nr:hypothetical protein [Dokdonella sp.]
MAVRASSVLETVSDSVPARWRDYALASITPQFSWALAPQALEPPRVLDNYSGRIERAPLFGMRTPGAELSISVANRVISDTPAVMPGQASHLVESPQSGLQRTVVAPSLALRWGDGGTVRLTGLLAYQRFATFNLGLAQTDGWAPPPSWLGDSSYGAGARMDIGHFVTDRLSWNVGYQSHVSMGSFDRYRGVFSDRADFDIPASVSASLEYAITPNFSADLGVQRVDYSSIRPFASSNLPRRFLALLGDGSSPVFAWKDLDVYSIGWTLRDETLGNVQLRYTTRQQPVPTSRLLANALASATANDMMSLGWSRAFGRDAKLSVVASYASSPYYLLMPTYITRSDATASRVEFEALWSVRF